MLTGRGTMDNGAVAVLPVNTPVIGAIVKIVSFAPVRPPLTLRTDVPLYTPAYLTSRCGEALFRAPSSPHATTSCSSLSFSELTL